MDVIARNKTIFRSLCLLLAAFSALTLCSCTGGGGTETGEPEPGTTSAQAETDAYAAAPFTAVENGEVVCKVVRGIDASDAEIDAAVAIRKALLAACPNSKVEITDDVTAKTSGGRMIIVGRTELPETAAALETIGYGDAVIRPMGESLIVLSMTDSGMSHLGSKAAELLSKLDQTGSVVIGEEDAYTKRVSAELAALPTYPAIPDKIIACNNRAYEVYFQYAKADVFDSYIEKLRSSGFSEVSDRRVGDNRFTVFTGNGSAVTAYYTASNKAARVIVEPDGNLFPSESESKPAVTTPLLTMIGRRYTNGNTYLDTPADTGLMCFLLRLSDGRFIVIDGGVSDGVSSYSAALYAKMLEQAPDPKNIEIAAWIFTHSHSDHVGGFVSFAATYASHVKLGCVISNFPSEAEFNSAGESLNDYNRWKGALGSFISLKQYKAHTGQRLNIGDATVEFLYTHEDFVTKTRSVGTVKNNWNNSSLIFSLEIAGQKIMFTGDSQEIPNNLTASIYGDYLKSDILQVCHHGGVGGTNQIYNRIDPEIALFTTSDELLPVYVSKWSYNYHLVNELHVKEYFNSADRITTFALPYHAKSSGFIKTTVN